MLVDSGVRPHRILMASAVLGVTVVIVAGIDGTIKFSGPRRLPNWFPKFHVTAPRGTLPKVTTPHVTPPPGHPVKQLIASSSLLWIFALVVAIGVAIVIWRLWLQRGNRDTPSWESIVDAEAVRQSPQEPDLPELRTGIEEALRILDEERDPTDAVVRAWLGLQETAESSGIVRQPAETPTEFTSRILNRALGDDRALQTLLRLYLQTRFGDHPVTAQDVAEVRAALQELTRTWPALSSAGRVAGR